MTRSWYAFGLIVTVQVVSPRKLKELPAKAGAVRHKKSNAVKAKTEIFTFITFSLHLFLVI